MIVENLAVNKHTHRKKINKKSTGGLFASCTAGIKSVSGSRIGTEI